jgi:hypothetical protein
MSPPPQITVTRVDRHWHAHIPDLDQLIHQARQARRRARTADERARRLTLQVLTATDQARFSGRDLGVLLGISHQRIQQLQRNPGKEAGRSADTLSG